MRRTNLKIYHGSTVIVREPDIEILNFKTDFGKGFYTTSDYEQAKRWVEIKIGRLKESNIKLGYINVYEYVENEKLKILNFGEATEEWLDFVFANRFSNKLYHTYDIVKGPVANDNLYGTLKLYERKLIDKESTLKRLKAYKLVNQISFHTEKSLKQLKYIGTEEVKYNG